MHANIPIDISYTGQWPTSVLSPSLTARSHGDTLFITLLPHTTTAIHVHYSPTDRIPHLHITLRPYATLYLVENSHSSSACPIETVFNADLQEHASLHHVHVDIGTTPMTSHNVQAVLQHHASMHSLCAAATKVSNYHVNVCLEGEASSIGLQGISIVPPHHRSTFTLNVEHKAPNTVSSHLYKGLVAHDGIGASQGQVAILRTAPKSISKQHSHFLTLGEHATTHNTPTFAIDIDDVSAVHGATSGTIDPETLFYAASRGLSESQARLHIAEGFCKEIVRQLPAEYIKPLSQAIGNAIGEII